MIVSLLTGCAMTAPMHVLHPARLNVPKAARIALAPIVAQENLSREMEAALLANQPSAPTAFQIVTAQELASAAPVRMASTAPLTSDLAAMHAARQTGADLLLMGEVVQDDLGQSDDASSNIPSQVDKYSNKPIFFAPESVQKPQRVAVAWRVFDVHTGYMVGNQTLAIDRFQADRKYPELQLTVPMPRERVIAASAKETWQAVTPYLETEDATIALPWIQPAAGQIRRGNAYARAGRWDLAETEWTIAATRNPLSNSAKLNLAYAQAAREDFEAAKATLSTMGPFRLRHRQSEALVWVDARHRWHHEALGLPPPVGGWAFPDPVQQSQRPLQPSTAPDPEDAPWWTAIPFTKPPGWTWRQWIFQPL